MIEFVYNLHDFEWRCYEVDNMKPKIVKGKSLKDALYNIFLYDNDVLYYFDIDFDDPEETRKAISKKFKKSGVIKILEQLDQLNISRLDAAYIN